MPWFLSINILQIYSNQNNMILTQSRHTDERNRIGSTETHPHRDDQLIHNWGAKNIHWGKDGFFKKWCRENWTATCKRMKLDHYLTLFFQKRHIDGSTDTWKLAQITDHQGNENKKHNEVVSHICKNGYHQKEDKDFPSGPEVKTLCFPCRGYGFYPWLGN